ncbi:MAG: hypothetical protein SGI99_07220 [Pseudomonadota bacterium]|nr:hypothetical protein [Pseudomonadota bacterium]
MKKYLFGFLVIATMLLLISGVAVWFFLIKPAAQMAGSAVDAARQGLGQVAAVAQTTETMRQMDARIDNKAAFAAPLDGRIDASQAARFVAVQSAVIATLGPGFTDVEASSDRPSGAMQISDRLAALARLPTLGITAKTAQVDALNAQNMSLSEYRWIRSAGIAALVKGGVTVALLEGATGASAGVAETARRAAQDAIAATSSVGEGIERARQAAAAASAALRGERHVAPRSVPAPVASPPESGAESAPLVIAPVEASVQEANFALVKPNVDVFTRAQMLAAIGL